MQHKILILALIVTNTSFVAADPKCKKNGEAYTIENMNLPACESTGQTGADPFKSGSGSGFNSGAGTDTGSGATGGSGSGTSGGSSGGFDAQSARGPASVTPQSNTAPQVSAPAGTSQGSSSTTGSNASQQNSGSGAGDAGINQNDGDAHWIK